MQIFYLFIFNKTQFKVSFVFPVIFWFQPDPLSCPRMLNTHTSSMVCFKLNPNCDGSIMKGG